MIMNGKELTAHGTFKAAKPIVVTVDDSGIVSHTPQQVFDYVQSGYDVVLDIEGAYIPPTRVDSNAVFFSTIDDEGFAYVWELCSTGLVYREHHYATQEVIPTGITKTLLWENASAGSSFGPQTIPVDNLSDFDEVEIYCLYRASSNLTTANHVRVQLIFNAKVVASAYSGEISQWIERTFIHAPAGVVVSGMMKAGNTGTINTALNMLVPYRIYGIKGVTTL